jgi:SM-20-related protein
MSLPSQSENNVNQNAGGSRPPAQFDAGSPAQGSADIGTGIIVIDDVLPSDEHRKINDLLVTGPWSYGWRSSNDVSAQPFWHRHFGGFTSDLDAQDERRLTDCSDELMKSAPLLFSFWQRLQIKAFPNYVLSRCYANGLPYGTDGGAHTDSPVPGDCTAIYYPHETWHPDWGGETIIFNQDRTDILTAVYPKPNRLFIFPGFVHHAARGVSRSCPHMRITLMFKTTRKK